MSLRKAKTPSSKTINRFKIEGKAIEHDDKRWVYLIIDGKRYRFDTDRQIESLQEIVTDLYWFLTGDTSWFEDEI